MKALTEDIVTENENHSNMSARSYTFNIGQSSKLGKINLVILHMTIGEIRQKTSSY